MKKLLSIILAVILMVAVVPFGALDLTASAGTYLHYTYSVTNGEATITHVSSYIKGDITIPSTLLSYTVTGIGYNAFDNCYDLTGVVIPSSVKTIGVSAFGGCSNLTSVTMCDGVESIGNNAFKYCTKLTNIVIPDSVTSIGDEAFSGCGSLTSIVIPDSVTSIGDEVFSFCRNLKNVTIGDGVTSIGYHMFEYCDNLENVTIGDGITSIDGSAFYQSGFYNKTSAWENDALYINKYLIRVRTTLLGSYNIKDGTTLIADEAFFGCEDLTSIVIPESVKSIGDSAFRCCSELESIMIPASVTSVGSYAFDKCEKLKDVYITDLIAWCNINFGSYVSNPLECADNLYLNGKLVENLVIPEGVTVIPICAFSCSSLESVTIPNSVTSINDYAFHECSNLTSIIIPDSVTSVGYSAFKGCVSLTSATIGNGVTSIDDYAFKDCTSLASVTIGKGVTSIGAEAFYNCKSLKSVDISDIAAWCNVKFEDYESNPISRAGNLYFKGELVRELVIPDGVTNISRYAFWGCYSFTSVVIPDGVEIIDCDAFRHCAFIEKIVIPSSVKSIGDNAFWDCNTSMSVYITDIAAWCNIDFNDKYSNPLYYYECSLYLNGALVRDLAIPNGVTKINNYAFYNYDNLTSVKISNSVTSIGLQAFNSCDGLARVVLPNSVTNIGWGAFEYCDNVIVCCDEGSYAQSYCITNYVPYTTNIFPDASRSDWYSAAVKYVDETGIMSGYANGYFGTADGIQRQDFLVMLERFDGPDLSEYSGAGKFGDVSENSYYAAAVNWGAESGIVNGYGNGNFGVGDMINREQLVTFLYRYAQYKELDVEVSEESVQQIKAKYPDYNNVSEYAQNAVLWAIDRGVISGKGGNQIAPFAGAQRCEVAQIMYNINSKEIF